MIRISESITQMEKNVYLCFIDYVKISDNLWDRDQFKLHRNLDLFSNHIRIIQNLYWRQTSCIQIENGFI